MIRNKILCVLCFIVIFNSQRLNADNSKMTSAKSPWKEPWNATATDRLKHKLLMHYDKFARPAQHYNTTTVTVGLTIMHVDIDEFKNTMTIYSWLKMNWVDEKLYWNSSDYEGLKVLHVADHEVWQPDIVPYNSAAGSTIDNYSNTHCLVYENGYVLWVPTTQFVVFCDLDFRLWPFDTQKCFIKLGSWTYDGTAIDLHAEKGLPDLELLVENSEWELTSLTSSRNVKTYACCAEPYPDVMFNITVRRRSPTYKAIIITPSFAVITMTLLSFWLPPNAGEKLLLNCCTAVLICLFLLYFSQKCPSMGNHTPLIVLFYSSSLYVISFCMIGSVIVIWISRTQHHRSIPWIIKHALTGWLGRWLGLSNYINQTSISGTGVAASRGGSVTSAGEELRDQLQHGGHVVGLNDDASDERHMLESASGRFESGSRHNDWLLLAAAIDRLSFIFYALLFAIMAIAYSI